MIRGHGGVCGLALFLFASTFLVVVGAVGGASAVQVASCTANETVVTPGETVRLDANASDASVVEFDTDGDGTYDRTVDTRPFVVNVSYDTAGSYGPVARADNEVTDPCGEITVTEPPQAAFSVSPNPATTGETVTFDGSNSTDPDGSIDEYRWDFDGDGTVDATENDSVTQHTYSTAGTYPNVTLTVIDDDGVADSAVGDVVVESRDLSCTVEPATVVTDQTVSVDASGAETFDFDFDGDGTFEVEDTPNRSQETSYSEPGAYQPRVRSGDTVVDCGTVEVEPNEPPEPAFSVTPRPGVAGQQMTFNASASLDPDGRIVTYLWDFESDGTVDTNTSTPVTNHTFGSAGTYNTSLTVVDDDGTAATVSELLEVTESREPTDQVTTPTTTDQVTTPTGTAATDTTATPPTGTPDASTQTDRRNLVCTVSEPSLAVGDNITIDATDSRGIESVDIDADGDGTYELTGRDSLRASVSYDSNGTYRPRVRSGNLTAPCGAVVVGGGTGGQSGGFLPGPAGLALGILAGGLLGLGLCRGLDGLPPFGGDGGAVAALASGTVRAPVGDTAAVDDIGFEPDLLLFTAANPTPDDRAAVTEGWSYGTAKRETDGSVSQNVLSVADDATERTSAALVRTGRALALLSYEGQEVRPLEGRVERTTAEGFEFGVDAPTADEEPSAGSVTVSYRAIALTDGTEAAIGHRRVPGGSGVESVPLGFDADHAIVTATDGVDRVDDPTVRTDRAGVSHGAAVSGEAGIDQQVVTSTVGTGTGSRNGFAGSVERVVDLPGANGSDPTTATVSSLADRLRLEFDSVGTGGVVTYVAIETGDDHRPAIGTFDLPAPEGDDRRHVETGFEPSMVSFTACPLDAVGGARSLRLSPVSYGWSHGTGLVAGGTVFQHSLHGTLGTAHTGSASTVTTATGRTRPERPDVAADGDSAAAVAVLSVGADGRILGRDEARMTGTTRTGFDVEVRDVSTHERPTGPERRPVVFYTAWPSVGDGR